MLTDLTIGGSTYKSYATVAEADTYLAADDVLADAWAGLADARKIRRLVSATRKLDTLPWLGIKAVQGQSTQWPRSELKDAQGDDLDETAVPGPVVDATILMAGNLSIDLSVSEVEDTTPLRSDRVGQKSAAYFYEGPRELDALLPRGIQGLLLLWLDYGTDYSGAVTGNDSESEFSQDYGVYGFP